LEKFDGSLVLAAAAYNAGAGNAAKWIAQYGDPRASGVDPVNWVEQIPFEETRKYVQRVLGNYLVYRARLGDTRMTISQALRRIPS
jgi:soluble lytic murein transglycosylase